MSASNTEPAFVARPVGAPVYHGFQLLDGVVVDGFTLGLITDSFAQAARHGDAFVVAPDGSRAGLIWEIAKQTYFETTTGPELERFGVFAVGVRHGPTTADEARMFLAEVVPCLRREWEKSRPKK